MVDYLQSLKERLFILRNNLREEKSSPNKSETYIDDLKMSIKEIKDEIKQLEFARVNPIVMVS